MTYMYYTTINLVTILTFKIKTFFRTHTVWLTLFSNSNSGIRTNLMKPIWAEGLVTLSRSMKGATGSPSDFSRSLCLKYSSKRQSTHGSAISVGRTSFDISHAFISIRFSCKINYIYRYNICILMSKLAHKNQTTNMLDDK